MNNHSPLKDYAKVFEAIPFPATLIDAQGIIVDLNQAFLNLAAHRLGRNLRKEERIGHPIKAFSGTEEGRTQMASFVHALLHHGEARHFQWQNVDRLGRPFYMNIHAEVIKDTAGQVLGALIVREDVTENVQQEQRRASQEQILQALGDMARSEDIYQVLQVLYRELKGLCPAIDACSVQVMNEDKDDDISYQITEESVKEIYRKSVVGTAVGTCWREQRVVYRPDLQQDDPYNEAELLWNVEGGYSPTVRAVLDVPFSEGTLAVNSRQPDAFTKVDVEILQEIAHLLSGSFARMGDLQTLEQRNRELEEEIGGRKQVEEQILRQNIVLNAINKVFSESMRCETQEEVAHTCLVVAKELTGSKFGFIGELNPVGLFDTLAISNLGWYALSRVKSFFSTTR